MRKLLFNYSLYSHREIGKFQGVTSCFTTSSCLLLLHHHPQITILIVVLNTILGFFFWLNLSPLGWAILCKMSHIMALVAHEVRNLFFLHFLVLALVLAF
jgi:hypothetical protein